MTEQNKLNKELEENSHNNEAGLRILNLYISKGIKPNNYTLETITCCYDSVEIAKICLEYTGIDDGYLIKMASEYGNDKLVEYYTEYLELDLKTVRFMLDT